MKFSFTGIKEIFAKIFKTRVKEEEQENNEVEQDNEEDKMDEAIPDSENNPLPDEQDELSADDLYAGFEDMFEKVQAEEPIDDTVKTLAGEYEEVEYDSLPDDLQAPVESMQQYIDEVRGKEKSEVENEVEAKDEADAEKSEVDAFLDQFTVQHVFTENVTVYDTEERNDKTEEQPEISEEEKKRQSLMFMVLLGVTGLLVIVIVVVYVIFFTLLKQSNSSKTAQEAARTISLPVNVPNHMNYVLVNDAKMLGETGIVLKKILLDSTSSVFYFKGYLDTRLYRFVLYDSSRKMYNMDLSFMLTQASEENENERETLIRFEPFGKAVAGLTLEITSITTNEKVSFMYTLDSSYSYSDVKYLDNPLKVDTGIEGLEILIENAVFSSASSTINYVIATEPGGEDKGSFGMGTQSESISLSEGIRTLTPLRSKPLEYEMSGHTTLGRMDFAVVKDLNSTVYFYFKNLLTNIDYKQTINPESLLNYRDADSQMTLDVGNYSIILERMGLQGETLVVVCHAEDKRTGERVEVILDTEMSIITDSGVEVLLSGDVKSSSKGSDIRYNISNYKNLLGKLTGVRYSLEINKIQIKLAEVVASLDLSSLPTEEKYMTHHSHASVINAFNSRLGYKSGRVSLKNVKGFSNSLLENEALMKNYEPQQAKNTAMFSAQIVAHYFDGETLCAIIQESWSAEIDGRESFFYRTHSIRAEKMNNDYVITEDKIL